ncbi:ornithine cyclodeaminase family protein [Microbacterium sp. GCS4]|uniref:ornithine cyclodeaminase family protein n=1 Tax=Microbacterium sp. GCS4 TaxID=1692239 RepID=UPI000A66B152|nr:ornithine cyclodeaminase family protein [Microbacterium sp. GCS4]
MSTEDRLAGAIALEPVIDAVRDAFVSFHNDEFDLPVRTSFGNGRILTMPVHHRPSSTAAVKVLRIDPARDPAISGAIVWTAPDGELVFDAADITAVRTGAVSGVATDLLARADSATLTIIGAGAQAFHQVAAVVAVRAIQEVRVVSRTPARTTRLVDRLRAQYPDVRITVPTDLGQALATTDVLTCATSALHPVFSADDLPNHIHINAVGSYRLDMREVPADAFTDADIVVDDWEAACEEAGDLMAALRSGQANEEGVTELGARLSAQQGARSDRTIFKSVGLAIQDWAAASAIARNRTHHVKDNNDSASHPPRAV